MHEKILITGVTGMLGSRLFEMAVAEKYDVYGTSRRQLEARHFSPQVFTKERIFIADITQKNEMARILDIVKPAAVINCLGVIKQKSDNIQELMAINAEFSHMLAALCTERDVRLIQISTDCVFSGNRGMYSEEDDPDPVDAYGESKYKGEITRPPHLTIRTSIIGIERGTNKSLVAWFLSNPPGSTVRGFKNAIWSGLTTIELSRILLELAVGKYRHITGTLHIASEPISKYDLLHLFRKHFNHEVQIEMNTEFKCDRSLASRRMKALGIHVSSMESMVAELAEELERS